ncbi:hypothetical protein HDU99_005689, partial [Rhizoclosmatium hyalinum]
MEPLETLSMETNTEDGYADELFDDKFDSMSTETRSSFDEGEVDNFENNSVLDDNVSQKENENEVAEEVVEIDNEAAETVVEQSDEDDQEEESDEENVLNYDQDEIDEENEEEWPEIIFDGAIEDALEGERDNPKCVTFNVHMLHHIESAIIRYGPLRDHWCFVDEHIIKILKSYYSNTNNQKASMAVMRRHVAVMFIELMKQVLGEPNSCPR